MNKRILAYAVIILLAGYFYSDYAKAGSDNTPLACIPEASGGLKFNAVRKEWQAKKFIPGKNFVLVLNEAGLITARSAANVLLDGEEYSSLITCDRSKYDEVVYCLYRSGTVFINFNPKTLKGTFAFMNGNLYFVDGRTDDLSVTAFSCTKF